MGYGSKYERDILIRLEKGVVTATEVRTNGRSEDQDAPEGYGIGAMTVFSTRDKDKEPL
jgi:hypothetical protein